MRKKSSPEGKISSPACQIGAMRLVGSCGGLPGWRARVRSAWLIESIRASSCETAAQERWRVARELSRPVEWWQASDLLTVRAPAGTVAGVSWVPTYYG